GQYETYSPASQSFARLVLISFARRLMTLQYEICGLMILIDSSVLMMKRTGVTFFKITPVRVR
ncbi:MAG: hypothetical protein QE493_02775, partial [Verrucomicrobiae bacterium]|nr:hypothetical protein [Verrucomicrobiae bacterium]